MQLIDKTHIVIHQPIVATIGFFDGVHIGHRYLIGQVRDEATRRGLQSAVITFPTHPRKVMHTNFQPALLCSYQEKLERLATTGVDYCISLDFTMDTSRLTAKDFMQQVLKNENNVDTLIIGYDHRFGRDRSDDINDYKRYGEELGIRVVEADEVPMYDHVSSTGIRHMLQDGKVKDAARLLSYNYTISGKIIEGFQVGRTIGFPTANMQIWERYKVIPALGVYAVYAHVDGQRYKAMLYIGKRPTLHADSDLSIEVNLFDFDGDLYNKELTAEFLEFVRGEEKFNDIGLLKAQIIRDKEMVIRILDTYTTS